MPAVPRRRSSRDEEPEDDRPRRRDRDDDREPEESPRRSRRVPADDDEEDDRPRSRARDDDEDDRPRSRRSRDDGDDDERSGRQPTGSKRKGWGGYRTNKEKGSDYADELKITNEPELVKFLEDEPVVSYRQHWIDSPPNGIKKKSWTCIEDDCPLCDIGDRPRLLTVFNVLHLSGGGDPENKVLILGTKAAGQLENFANDPKTGPLSREDIYWAISKSGKGTSTAYNFQAVKERDLDDDWQIPPLTEDEYDDAMKRLYDDTVVTVPTRKQLRELAEGLVDDDD